MTLRSWYSILKDWITEKWECPSLSITADSTKVEAGRALEAPPSTKR